MITGTIQVTTGYHAFGGAMVAMRDGAGAPLTYLHGDHIGSASLTTNASGQKVSEQPFDKLRAGCYKPYGEVRWSSGAGMPTDFTFTSQRASSYGTIFMSAREYLPSLGLDVAIPRRQAPSNLGPIELPAPAREVLPPGLLIREVRLLEAAIRPAQIDARIRAHPWPTISSSPMAPS